MAALRDYLSLVKFSHTVFALPFALVGLGLGFRDTALFDPWKLVWVLACMITARNAAMAFNRWQDRRIDAANPRTAQREIPAGLIAPQQALAFVVVNCLLFILSAALINRLCFLLSPVALAVILGYSYTKRFTALCHFVLGLGLGLAPVGAYIAVTEVFSGSILLLGSVVVTWVAGFDIIYALQDEEFDRQQALFSIPAALGRVGALRLSWAVHLLTAALMLAFAWHSTAHWLVWSGALVFVGLTLYQHLLVSAHDLSRINLAFFTTNGIASLIFGAMSLTGIWLQNPWFKP